MKNILKKIYYFIAYEFFNIQFRKLINSDIDNDLYIFDIDNTIANTWPSFNASYTSTKKRLENIKPFENMMKLINELYIKNNKIIFLTARDYRYYFTTKRWLIKNNIYKNNLIMVLKPQQKIKLLKNIKHKVFFYDDLSYNHENGEVKYYNDCIEVVTKLQYIEYINYEKIKLIQGRI